MLVSPFLFTAAVCYSQGNPGGCGDIIFLFLPLSVLVPILGLAGLIVLIVSSFSGRKTEAEKPTPPAAPGFSKCELCGNHTDPALPRCAKCGKLQSQPTSKA